MRNKNKNINSDAWYPGKELIIHRRLIPEQADISGLVKNYKLEEVQAMLASSIEAEGCRYETLVKTANEWEEQAIHTQHLKQAIKHLAFQNVPNTGNKWSAVIPSKEYPDISDFIFEPKVGNITDNAVYKKANYLNRTRHIRGVISNTVYQMYFEIKEYTIYDTETKQLVPCKWKVFWNVSVQNASNIRDDNMIAGQENKCFYSTQEAEKYVMGRIKKYAPLFSEANPVIPTEYKRFFTIGKTLLPGYQVEK